MNIKHLMVNNVQSIEFVRNKDELYDLRGTLSCADIVRPNEEFTVEFESKNFKLDPSFNNIEDDRGRVKSEFNFKLSKDETLGKILSEKRMEELRNLIGLYLEANEKIPTKLLDEYNDLWR